MLPWKRPHKNQTATTNQAACLNFFYFYRKHSSTFLLSYDYCYPGEKQIKQAGCVPAGRIVMKLFLDTADLEQIKEAESWGVIDGVTTNPSLIKKAVLAMRESGTEIDIEGYIKQILATAGRMCPVSLEVAGLQAEVMVEQGLLLYEKFNQVAGNVVIKIPVCPVHPQGNGEPFDGIKAISVLSDEKVPVNATLIFTPEQALLAAKAGAEFVSPFAGRVDDRIRRTCG